MPENKKTLFELLGGDSAIDAAVDSFYGKVLKDKRLAHFFDGIDDEKMRAHQKAFMTYAFGGTEEYSGKSLRESHAHLVAEMGLNDTHFNAVAEHLRETLRELDVASDLISEVMAIIEGTRDCILNR